jgi:hypothetical protein
MNLRLVPVVEFEPSMLGISDYLELCERGLWVERWNDVLAARGLRPIRPGSWHVATSEFRGDAAFDALVRAYVTDGVELSPGKIPALDGISPISGGYAFSVDDTIQLEPGCCCDLSDLSEWGVAVRQGQGPASLLIGHGNLSLRVEGSMTTLTVNSEVAREDALTLQYPAADLARAVEQAELEQNAFADALKAYLLRYAPSERIQQVVQRLVFGL